MDQVVAQALSLYAQLAERPSWHPEEENAPVKKAIAPDTASNRSFQPSPSKLPLTNFSAANLGKPEKSNGNGKALSPTQNGST
jgi:hypothetical protein